MAPGFQNKYDTISLHIKVSNCGLLHAYNVNGKLNHSFSIVLLPNKLRQLTCLFSSFAHMTLQVSYQHMFFMIYLALTDVSMAISFTIVSENMIWCSLIDRILVIALSENWTTNFGWFILWYVTWINWHFSISTVFVNWSCVESQKGKIDIFPFFLWSPHI